MSNEMIRQDASMELSIPQLVEKMEKVREVMKKAMIQDVDYGVIPGTRSKPTLLKPGAEKLCQMFRLADEYDETVIELPNGHREYRVKCRLRHMPSDTIVGEASATATTMESKYRYRGNAAESTGQPIPGKYWDTKKENPQQAQAMLGGPGFCAKKIDGAWMICKVGEKQENPDIADSYHTVQSIAQKRAYLAATRKATASSEMFTDSMEDHAVEGHPQEPASETSSMPDDRRPVAPKPAAVFPPCPKCGAHEMKIKKRKSDGQEFLGCPKKYNGEWCNGALPLPATGEESQVEPEPGNQQQSKPPKGCERFEHQLRGILNDIGCKGVQDASAVIEFIAPGITLAAAKANELDCGKVVDAIEAACTFQGMTYAQIYADAMGPREPAGASA